MLFHRLPWALLLAATLSSVFADTDLRDHPIVGEDGPHYLDSDAGGKWVATALGTGLTIPATVGNIIRLRLSEGYGPHSNDLPSRYLGTS